MSEICTNQVLEFFPGLLPITGLVRVLWIDQRAETVAVIRIDQEKRSKPVRIKLSLLVEATALGQTKATSLTVDPRSLMSDEQLTMLYPSQSKEGRPYVLEFRDFWWPVIGAIAAESDRIFSGLIRLNRLVVEHATARNLSRQRIYQLIYRYWASGSVMAALLPDSNRCGGAGKPRTDGTRRLGRRELANAIQGLPSDNFALSNEDIDRIHYGWKTYLTQGVSVKQAYQQTLTLFYADKWEKDGRTAKPVLMERKKRPSITQFRYHGPRQPDGKTAWRAQVGERDYQLNRRPLEGLSNRGLSRIGAIGQADASTNDLHLRSAFSRTRIVGACNVLIIADEFTGLVTGFVVAWSIDSEAVKLVLLVSASSKVDLCARYGIEIKDDDWPRAVYGRIRADHGEFNCEAGFAGCEAINSTLEMVRTGRGDMKGLVEQLHDTLHTMTGHQLPGTTRGKRKGRGESDPALDSCMTMEEYNRHLIRAIIHYNTKEPVAHLLTTEMLEDDVEPTRLAIWKWAQKRGYVAFTAWDQDRLITTLCSQIDAVIDADGVYLLAKRPPPAADEVRLQKFRYLGEIAKRENWLETARNSGVRRIRVFHNPYDLRRVWYLDLQVGLMPLDLLTNDPLLGAVSTLYDVIQMQSQLQVRTKMQEDIALQSRVQMAVQRDAEVKVAEDQTAAAYALIGGIPSNAKQLRDRRDNRAQEVAHAGKISAPPLGNQTFDAPVIAERMPRSAKVLSLPARKTGNSAIEQWLSEGELS
jgi:putative transposase